MIFKIIVVILIIINLYLISKILVGICSEEEERRKIMEILNCYTMEKNSNNEILFKKINEEDLTLYGRPLNELLIIINGLDAERMTEIKMCMENLVEYQKIINEEIKKENEEALKRAMKDLNLT